MIVADVLIFLSRLYFSYLRHLISEGKKKKKCHDQNFQFNYKLLNLSEITQLGLSFFFFELISVIIEYLIALLESILHLLMM